MIIEFEETRSYGTIVAIVESSTRLQNHVGTLFLERPGTLDEEKTDQIGRFVWFKPNDKRVPYILIPSQIVPSEIIKSRSDWETNLYTSRITSWVESSIYPIGAFTGHLGQMGELPTESAALLVAAGINWEDFSDEVIESLVPTVLICLTYLAVGDSAIGAR